MDLAIGAKQVFVMMTLFAKDGTPKLVPRCTYPLTGIGCVSRVYTDHGVFTVGAGAKAAVKAAVMCEDVARTVHIARQGGPLQRLPQEHIDALHDRYQNVYGQ